MLKVRRAGIILALAGISAGGCSSAPSASPPLGTDTPPSISPPATSWSEPSTQPASPAHRPLSQHHQYCAAAVLAEMDLRERVGQLLMVGVPAQRSWDGITLVRTHRLGGVFLRGRSTAKTGKIRRGLDRLQAASRQAGGLPLHVAVDQEGGLVQTLHGPDFPPIPSAVKQSRWSRSTLEARTREWAQRLSRAGVTLNLAPVADTVPVDLADSNPPIGEFDRQYGATPDAVAARTAAVVEAMQAAGVAATLKHFPGLGRVRVNTDFSSRAVDATATAKDPHLRPFQKGIAAGANAVMISSAHYPHLDASRIATFSPAIIQDLLRERLGYDGLVISDDLGAAVAVQAVPAGQRAVGFLAAGGDMVLTVRPKDAKPMIEAMMERARRKPSFRTRVDGAALHVITAKIQAGLLPCPPAPPDP